MLVDGLYLLTFTDDELTMMHLPGGGKTYEVAIQEEIERRIHMLERLARRHPVPFHDGTLLVFTSNQRFMRLRTPVRRVPPVQSL